MTWYFTGLLLILQFYFWGIGLVLLVLPARWRRFWPAFCAPAGVGLQSLVVWAGAHSTLRGTDAYGAVSQLLPLALLATAVWRLRFVAFRRTLAAAGRWWAVASIMAATFALQAYPFTKPPGLLTSQALGSCDAADYAAGARVFKEFASQDRFGFIGLTEVVRLLSVDNFFDFWLRLNHFTPSALIALNATLLGRQPYELASLLAVVLATIALPTFFWLFRSAFRFGRRASVLLTAVCAFSPILFYIVYQDALGQLLAAPAVALLFWAGTKAYHARAGWRRGRSYFTLLLLGNWLLLGSYNFFLLFAYIPLVAYAGGRTLLERTWRRGLAWAAFVGANLLLCALIFPARALSIVDRFRLFNKTPFGWDIPPFEPTGWYGAFSDIRLHPAAPGWPRLFGALCLGAAAWGIVRQWRRAPNISGLLAACALPIFVGYAILVRQERLYHDNASYDAFKLFTVFYPGLLASLCLWLRGLGDTPGGTRLAAGALGTALLGVNVSAALQFNDAVRHQSLRVDPWLKQIGTVEQMTGVRSVNICLDDYWSRLWANYFLLRKPQYFAQATYEGRRVTPLRGEWDLRDEVLEVRPASGAVALNGGYYLIQRTQPAYLELQFGRGWFGVEHVGENYRCWSNGSSQLTIGNPHVYPISAAVEISLQAPAHRQVSVTYNARELWAGVVDQTGTNITLPAVTWLPGNTVLRFDSPDPPGPLNAGETRALTFALRHIKLDPTQGEVPVKGRQTSQDQ